MSRYDLYSLNSVHKKKKIMQTIYLDVWFGYLKNAVNILGADRMKAICFHFFLD